MKKIILTLLILSFSAASYAAAKGGATSGGGDTFGLEASRVTDQVFKSIDKLGDLAYSLEEIQIIHDIKKEIKIVMVDKDLPASVNGATQLGSAFSIRENNQSTIFIKREAWNATSTLLEREVLIHHELMVLAGIEETGTYSRSLKFEGHRKNFWKLADQKKVLCSINVFTKDNYYQDVVPGKLIGSSSTLIASPGSKNAWGILGTTENKKTLIWRGVISSNGYFRMELGESNKTVKELSQFAATFGELKVVQAEKVYFDPYQLEGLVSTPISFGDNYAIAVNCNQF